jgi:hypothetical protein
LNVEQVALRPLLPVSNQTHHLNAPIQSESMTYAAQIP